MTTTIKAAGSFAGLALLAAAMFPGASAQETSSAQRPNVILIVSDNQSARLLGAYGNNEIATPHIDALARSGVLFRNAFAASGVCSPARAALLTGLMPSQTGIHVALPPQPELEGWSAIEEFRNLPQTLADAGYFTGLVGKYHLGRHENPIMPNIEILSRPAPAPVVAESDVVVVGGGPAGVAAAVSAARNGASVTLLERYPYLGGLASGGMVLVLDDMHNDAEISVLGLAMEAIDRMAARGLCVYPPESDRDPAVRATEAMWRKWSRWGVFDFHTHTKPHPVIFAAAFDPDGFKQASLDMVGEAGVNLRLHSWFQSAIVEDGRAAGAIAMTKEGPQAVRARIVVDATGDLDVAASAGAAFVDGAFIVSTVSRIGGVDTDAAERFQFEEPERFSEIDRQAKRIIGGCWQYWWLKTPLPGVVWCNCPHMTGFDGMKVADLTAAEFEGRRRMQGLLAFARENVPGFGEAYFVDFAPQTGVRQTRLLEGEYVVTKRDVIDRVHFRDSVCRGRDYYTPYRALLPKGVEQLLVAGRHYSATPQAQKISREIPPCMAMGEAVGIAAALALESDALVRDVDAGAIQRRMRAQGADPGDRPAANARLPEAA